MSLQQMSSRHNWVLQSMSPFLCEINWSALAAWVQAIGSIAAIGVAIWVPYDMDRKARLRSQQAERRRQRHTQISLLPTLYELRSKTEEFLSEQSGEPSFLGVERDASEFDSDFFALVPKFIEILRVSPDAGQIDEQLAKISISLFQINDCLRQNTKLQCDGYHAAWQNHKDLFIESAQSIHELVKMLIGCIEIHEADIRRS